LDSEDLDMAKRRVWQAWARIFAALICAVALAANNEPTISATCVQNVRQAAGVADALRDGLLLMRYAQGFRGAQLVAGTGADSDLVSAFIAENLYAYDFNRNGVLDPNDALQASRAMFGLSDAMCQVPMMSGIPPLVFVSRQIGPNGSIYYDQAKDMAGVGSHSRFRSAAPGQLIVRETSGRQRVLVDGAQPTAASLNLVDVNAPDVSYDGTRIVFSGLPASAATNQLGPERYAGAWRLYIINVDGSGLRQLTQEEPDREAAIAARQLPGALAPFDDGDPVWLPNGDVAFSSTRWPSYAHYSGVRTTNLYTIAPDGSALRRITAERNGADRPLVDPQTGAIVYSRWWRNHRFPLDSIATVAEAGGYRQKDGLTRDRTSTTPNAEIMFRNHWQATTINPDGTALAMWSGRGRDEPGNHIYGGSFDSLGRLIANFFPMFNMTEAAGFGGLRRFTRGPSDRVPIIGITDITGDPSRYVAPNSFGIYKLGSNEYYAGEPSVLADGRILVSLARDINQDYGLYVINADGTSPQLVFDRPGVAELRARPIIARALPPVLPRATTPPPLYPPAGTEPLNSAGTFIFDALNVYANGPVDAPIVNAPPVGSAANIRFYIDHQRQSSGSFEHLDWPILLNVLPISAAGAVRDANAPAHVPLFEQLRASDGKVTLTDVNGSRAAAHVAGMNFGGSGTTASCVGCHAGHTMIPIPADPAFSNVAPGASVRVSSTRDANQNRGLIDRQVLRGEIWRYWTSASGQATNQWVELSFPVPVTVRTVRLYNPRSGGEANSSIQVQSATVFVCADSLCATTTAQQSAGALSSSGTDVSFAEVRGRAVRVRIDSVSGTFYGANVASLAEIEVIARGEAP
jgi:hypothetical protein